MSNVIADFIIANAKALQQLIDLTAYLVILMLIPLLEALRTRVYHLLTLSRPINCIMVIFGVITAAFISVDQVYMYADKILLAAIVAALITAGGNTIDDYFDRKIDQINKPNRPLPSGKIKPELALVYAFLLFLFGIFLSFELPKSCMLLAAVNSIILVFYPKIKNISGIVGNIIISYLTASVFIFGALLGQNIHAGALMALITFFAVFAREIVKDIEDLQGDRCMGRKTIPIIFGKDFAAKIAAITLILAMLLSPTLFFSDNLVSSGFLLLLPSFAMFVYAIYLSFTLTNIRKAQKFIKAGMLLSILAFFMSSKNFWLLINA